MKNFIFVATEFARNNLSNFSKERGGLIKKQKQVVIEEFFNESSNDEKYLASFNKSLLKDSITVGFWHTHEKYALPSIRDMLQMLVLNVKYKKCFCMVIFTPTKICMVSFWGYLVPWLKIEKYSQ